MPDICPRTARSVCGLQDSVRGARSALARRFSDHRRRGEPPRQGTTSCCRLSGRSAPGSARLCRLAPLVRGGLAPLASAGREPL